MGNPLSGDQDLAKAYENGRCRDCGSHIQPFGQSSRCEPCSLKREEYEDSDWGLDKLVNRKITDRDVLGLCFLCGDNLTEEEGALVCPNCRWNREMWKTGHKVAILADTNPYKKVWDAQEDNSVYLVATHETVATRMRAKAKYYKTIAERGGPRGREALKEAAAYNRIADDMEAKGKELRRLR